MLNSRSEGEGRLTRASKVVITPTVGGAGRLGERMLEPILGMNISEGPVAVLPRYVDAEPGKATHLAERAGRLGIPATGEVGWIEDAAIDTTEINDPLWNTIDTPGGHADVLESTAATGRPVVGSLLGRLSGSGELWGLRYAYSADDTLGRFDAARLFNGLAPYTSGTGSEAVLGPRWPDALVLEPGLRSWIAQHVTETFATFAAGRPLSSARLELTVDGGMTTLPVVVSSGRELGDPKELAIEFFTNPPYPILRANDYVIAEVSSSVVRFSRVRIRGIDGRVQARVSKTIARPTVDQFPSDRRSVTALDPISTTD